MSRTMTWTGLAAETWDATGGDEPQWDHDYFRTLLKENPGPALDVGCGSGRLLIRFLSYGLDVDGIDTSADMLRICREKAAAQGVKPNLYQQSMVTMALPRTYRTIIVPCGSFMLVLDKEEARQTLHRFHDHLQPDGLLAMTFFDMWGVSDDTTIGEWQTQWRIDDLPGFPQGSVLEVDFYTESVDRLDQVYRGQRRYKLLRNGDLVREQYLEDTFRWYTPDQIRTLLETADFEVLSIKGNDLDVTVNESHWGMMVVARRQG